MLRALGSTEVEVESTRGETTGGTTRGETSWDETTRGGNCLGRNDPASRIAPMLTELFYISVIEAIVCV